MVAHAQAAGVRRHALPMYGRTDTLQKGFEMGSDPGQGLFSAVPSTSPDRICVIIKKRMGVFAFNGEGAG